MEKELIKVIKSCFGIVKKKELDLLKKNNIKISEIKKYDSLNYMKFMSELEKKFKVKINKTNLYKFNNFKAVLKYLKSKKK
tara:strand:+ start:1656 stop:1898 length:243 start_codon:yes stop_codon:yes gene_type:complete